MRVGFVSALIINILLTPRVLIISNTERKRIRIHVQMASWLFSSLWELSLPTEVNAIHYIATAVISAVLTLTLCHCLNGRGKERGIYLSTHELFSRLLYLFRHGSQDGNHEETNSEEGQGIAVWQEDSQKGFI